MGEDAVIEAVKRLPTVKAWSTGRVATPPPERAGQRRQETYGDQRSRDADHSGQSASHDREGSRGAR